MVITLVPFSVSLGGGLRWEGSSIAPRERGMTSMGERTYFSARAAALAASSSSSLSRDSRDSRDAWGVWLRGGVVERGCG